MRSPTGSAFTCVTGATWLLKVLSCPQRSLVLLLLGFPYLFLGLFFLPPQPLRFYSLTQTITLYLRKWLLEIFQYLRKHFNLHSIWFIVLFLFIHNNNIVNTWKNAVFKFYCFLSRKKNWIRQKRKNTKIVKECKWKGKISHLWKFCKIFIAYLIIKFVKYIFFPVSILKIFLYFDSMNRVVKNKFCRVKQLTLFIPLTSMNLTFHLHILFHLHYTYTYKRDNFEKNHFCWWKWISLVREKFVLYKNIPHWQKRCIFFKDNFCYLCK